MDKIIVLVLIQFLPIANAQLHCFVCTNCPEANDLDASFSRACDSLPPSNTPPTVTTPNTPPTATVEISASPDFVYSTVDIDLTTITVTPPNTPPTATVEISASPDFVHSTVEIDSSTVTVETTTYATPPTVEIDPSTPDPKQPTSELPSIPTTTPQVPSPPPFLSNHKYGSVGIQFDGTNHCFRIERRVDNDIEVNRGCVAIANTVHDTCIRANFGVTPTRCRICRFNDCNKAAGYTTSLIVIFSGILAITMLR